MQPEKERGQRCLAEVSEEISQLRHAGHRKVNAAKPALEISITWSAIHSRWFSRSRTYINIFTKIHINAHTYK